MTNDDGFNVVDELTPREWVNHDFDHHGEYVHLIADREVGELRCYRCISEPGVDNERIMTTIEDVNFRYYSDGDINHWYLTYMEAMSFMSFVDLLTLTRDSSLSFEWSDSDGGTMMDDEKTNMESIILGFINREGKDRNLQIRSEWQSAKSHRMASIEGESY